MRFFIPNRQPTPKQWQAMLSEFAPLYERGLDLDEIAYRMEVTRGTACVLRHSHVHGGQ